MSFCFADASAILRFVLNQPDALDLAIIGDVVASALAEVECRRVLDRIRLLGAFSAGELEAQRESLSQFLERIVLLDVDRKTLMRASGPLEVALGTLDAIHLSTALFWRETQDQPIEFATHDRALARAARLHNFTVVGNSETL